MSYDLCTDCRDAPLLSEQEKACRLCSSCYADLLEAERGH